MTLSCEFLWIGWFYILFVLLFGACSVWTWFILSTLTGTRIWLPTGSPWKSTVLRLFTCLFILTRPACPPSPLTLSVSHCELTRLALSTIGHCRLDLGQQQHSNTLTLCCWLTGLFLSPVHVWDKVQINHSAQLLYSPGPLLVISNRLSFSFTIPAFCTDFPLLFFVRCHAQ